jgi:hypothetical protein
MGDWGQIALNKPKSDEHFGTKCSHLPLLAATVFYDKTRLSVI